MILAALLESGGGLVHAIYELVPHAWGDRNGGCFPLGARLAVAALFLVRATKVAKRVGLVALITRGYRLMAVELLCVYVLPLLALGVARLRRPSRPSPLKTG